MNETRIDVPPELQGIVDFLGGKIVAVADYYDVSSVALVVGKRVMRVVSSRTEKDSLRQLDLFRNDKAHGNRAWCSPYWYKKLTGAAEERKIIPFRRARA